MTSSSPTTPLPSLTSTMATMTPTPSSTPSPPPQNSGNSIATSASLYLYTFLATLVLLLSVSAAIVVRSFILRRRHRLMVEEAIRNGTWVPPSPPSRPARVDLSKKPVLWEAYIDDKGAVSTWRADTGGQGTPHDHWRAEQARDWDFIKPFSAAYFNKTAEPANLGLSANFTSRSTHSLPGNNNVGTSPSTTSIRGMAVVGDASANDMTAPTSPAIPSAAGVGAAASLSPASIADSDPAPPPSRRRALLSRALRVLNPTPAPTSPLPAPATAGSALAGGVRGTEHAMAELQQRSVAPSMMRVAVLIAMPTLGQSQHQHPERGMPLPHDDEHPLPHLEVGVAEVLVVPAEPQASPYVSGKREMRDSVASRESDASEV